jgi:hypothetical protein
MKQQLKDAAIGLVTLLAFAFFIGVAVRAFAWLFMLGYNLW